jgi:hypothetical protein
MEKMIGIRAADIKYMMDKDKTVWFFFLICEDL